jgi:hypothetical protein
MAEKPKPPALRLVGDSDDSKIGFKGSAERQKKYFFTGLARRSS